MGSFNLQQIQSITICNCVFPLNLSFSLQKTPKIIVLYQFFSENGHIVYQIEGKEQHAYTKVLHYAGTGLRKNVKYFNFAS